MTAHTERVHAAQHAAYAALDNLADTAWMAGSTFNTSHACEDALRQLTHTARTAIADLTVAALGLEETP